MTPQELRQCAGCHCLAARREARAISRVYDARLRRHGLKATQFAVLVALALSGETPIGSLATTLGLERTTLTRGAALLQERGWVTEALSSDPRKRPLKLTAAGQRKLEAAFPAWKEAQETVESSRTQKHRHKS
jgi:DNA-binding MarR family transcriptional regulator